MPVARPLSPAVTHLPRVAAKPHRLCQLAQAPARAPARQAHRLVTQANGFADGVRTLVQTASHAPATLLAMGQAQATVWRTCGPQLARLVGPGTLAGSQPFLSVAGGLVGSIASAALAHDLYKRLPAQQQAQVRETLHRLARSLDAVGPYASAIILGGLSATLAQEGAVRWLEARHASAALMLVSALPLGLSSLETLGKKLNIPLMRKAWSGPAQFCDKHQRDVGGALLGATGMASASFAWRMVAANNPWGWLLMAGSVPAMLGGLELVGREHDIEALRTCLTEPLSWSVAQVRKVVSQREALQTVGMTLALAGLWGIRAGMVHLGVPASGLGDALGAAQITAGTVAAGLGTGMVAEQRKWIDAREHVFERYNDAMASGMFSAWGTALAKFAAFNIVAFGPAYINTAAAVIGLGLVNTGVIAGFRQTQKQPGSTTVAPQMDERIGHALDRTWALSGSLGSASWAALVARGLLQGSDAAALLSTLNAVPQLAATATLGAVSLGMMGYALNNARMKQLSNDVADSVKQGAEQTMNFAGKHPLPTLVGLAALLVMAKRSL